MVVSLTSSRPRAVRGADPADEVADQRAILLAAQPLLDQLRGRGDREVDRLAAESRDRDLPLALQLLPRAREQLLLLGAGPLQQLAPDPLARLPRLLQDLLRLLP